MASIAEGHSLFEIDRELDTLLDEIEEEIESRGEASAELMERFQQFCEAHSEKADRIGRFLHMMEARVQYCRSEASRLQERARSSEHKASQTKYMVMYYLKSHELRKIEGREFTAGMIRHGKRKFTKPRRLETGLRLPHLDHSKSASVGQSSFARVEARRVGAECAECA